MLFVFSDLQHKAPTGWRGVKRSQRKLPRCYRASRLYFFGRLLRSYRVFLNNSAPTLCIVAHEKTAERINNSLASHVKIVNNTTWDVERREKEMDGKEKRGWTGRLSMFQESHNEVRPMLVLPDVNKTNRHVAFPWKLGDFRLFEIIVPPRPALHLSRQREQVMPAAPSIHPPLQSPQLRDGWPPITSHWPRLR